MAGQVKPAMWAPGIVPVGHPLRNGLVGLWPLWAGSGNRAMDVSENGNGGVITGATWASGRLLFNGAGDVITIPDSPSLRFGTGDFTLWAVYETDGNNDQIGSIMGKGDTGAGEWMWNVDVNNTGNPRFYGDNGDTSAQSTEANADGVIFNSAVVRQGSTVTMYQDTRVIATDATASGDFNSGKGLEIGGADGNAIREFGGVLYAAGIWNRALSVFELADLYANPYALITMPDDIALWSAATIGGVPPPGTPTANPFSKPFYGPLRRAIA